MTLVDLDQVKAFLRVDHDDDDAQLSVLIEASEGRVAAFLKRDLAVDYANSLPKEVETAVSLLVAMLYDGQLEMSDGRVPEIVRMMVSHLRVLS